jgi:hypothetical protein
MDINYYLKQVTAGSKFEYTALTNGWTEVLVPRVQNILDVEDSKVHDIKLTEEERIFAMGRYSMAKDILNFNKTLNKEKLSAIEYCKENNIPLP